MQTRMNKQDAEIKHHSDIIRILNKSWINLKSSPDGVPPLLPTSCMKTIHPKGSVNTVMETDNAIKNYYDDDEDEENDDDDEWTFFSA